MKVPKSVKSNISETDLISCSPHDVESVLIETYQHKTLDIDKAQRMAEFFSLLGDSNRLRILSILAQQELCVCDLAATLNMSESAVSHQLRTLKVMRLVAYQKRGRRTGALSCYYAKAVDGTHGLVGLIGGVRHHNHAAHPPDIQTLTARRKEKRARCRS